MDTTQLRTAGIRVTWEPDVQRRPRSVAIGSFDGVHLGHRRVIAGATTVLTFDPHPLRVLRPEVAPQLLSGLADKARRLARLGVTEVVVIPFDRAWAQREAAAFIDEVLVDRLDARHVSVGANFRFGARGVGDPELLRADRRFTTAVAPLQTAGNDVVSSTRIRALVARGEVEAAARLLDGPLTHLAEFDGDGRVTFDPALAVPPAGRYAVTVDGSPAVLRLHAVAGPVLQTAVGRTGPGTAEVGFLRRLAG